MATTEPTTDAQAAEQVFFDHDSSIAAAHMEYLTTHSIKEKMAAMYEGIVVTKPLLPIQYMIDYLSFSDKEKATQDDLGLSVWRQEWLTTVFEKMDKDGSGSIDFKEISEYSSKYGSEALNEEQLRGIFKDFDTSGDNLISPMEFKIFFARALRHVSNAEFERSMMDMTAK